MELWVMTQALADMTGYTCLYAVCTIAAHAHSPFLFSICVVRITQMQRSAGNIQPPWENCNAPTVFVSVLWSIGVADF